VPAAQVPEGPAGKQLSWLLDATKALPIDGPVVTEHMSAAFVEQVPPAEFNEILSSLAPQGGLVLTSIEVGTPTAVVGIVDSIQGPMQVSLSTQADGKIQGLFFKPVP
ncbi:MAG: Cpe/LpqF family protein, partial [Micrococcaceae bacterium]|nr:Cpe/LpqF family protein [Micrococcaceae bacterium]